MSRPIPPSGTVGAAEAEYRVSSLSPQVTHNRINNPYRPSSGYSIEGELQIAGGFLGGDTYFLRPQLRYTGYFRAIRNTFLGIHAEGGVIRSWAGGSAPNSANVEGVPRSQRYFLGGDIFGPRVFETRAVTPLRYVKLDPSRQFVIETTTDPRGRPATDFDVNGDRIVDRRDLVDVGGDRYVMMQAEYVIPIQTSMEIAEAGSGLVLRKTLNPGESCEALLKIPFNHTQAMYGW